MRPLSHSLSLLLALSLMGCATQSTPVLVERVLPEQSCLQPAEALPQLKTRQTEEAIRLLPKVADLYWELAGRHQCLVDFLR